MAANRSSVTNESIIYHVVWVVRVGYARTVELADCVGGPFSDPFLVGSLGGEVVVVHFGGLARRARVLYKLYISLYSHGHVFKAWEGKGSLSRPIDHSYVHW